MRKARVSDVVISFVYGLKTGEAWPFPLLGRQWEASSQQVKASALAAFTCFAYTNERNYILADRHIVLAASHLRDFSEAEQDYAASLLITYHIKDKDFSNVWLR